MIENFWNAAKSVWSRLNDYFMQSQLRAPVPAFKSPADAGSYLYLNAKYTGDPAKGAGDFYLHPERLQAAMLNPKMFDRLHVDCDDYATWAYAALRQVEGVTPYLMTLMDGSGKLGHHVICAYRHDTPSGSVYGAIDTSGWQPLATLAEQAICKRWTDMYAGYGLSYIRATVTEYPF